MNFSKLFIYKIIYLLFINIINIIYEQGVYTKSNMFSIYLLRNSAAPFGGRLLHGFSLLFIFITRQ